MRLPVLHLSVPDVPCALFVNGALLGQSTDHPVLPVSPDGMVYITCLPIAGASDRLALPLTVSFSLYEGLPNAAVYGCTLYIDQDGIIDIQLCPTVLPWPLDDQISTVSCATFPYNRHPHAATLYHENGWHITIEDIDHSLLLICHTIHDFQSGQVQIVRCFTSVDVFVTGQGQNGPRCLLFTPVDGHYEIIADEDAAGIPGDHTLVCTASLQDTAGHERRYSLTLNENQVERSESVYGFFNKTFQMPDTPVSVCAALCEAVALSLLDEALSYLSPELGDGMTLLDLSEFFGPFDHVHTVTGEGPYLLSLAYASYENVYRLQSYVCEMDGLRICNITPQE